MSGRLLELTALRADDLDDVFTLMTLPTIRLVIYDDTLLME